MDEEPLTLSDKKVALFAKAFKYASKTEDLLLAKSCKYNNTIGHVFCTKTTLHFYGKLFNKKIKVRARHCGGMAAWA